MGISLRNLGSVGVALSILLAGGLGSANAATLPAGFTEANYGASTGSNSTAMAFAPDGRLFVCQQNGALRVIDATGTLLATPFVTLTVDSNGERGLLGVAFDPSYASNHFVYVYYTVPAGPSNSPPAHNRVSRFTADTTPGVDENVAVAGSEVQILNLEDLSSIATNHNGGAIHFGPDGKLYVAVGENANTANSQLLTNRLGKILRVNSDGSPAAGNPTTFTFGNGTTGSTTGVNQAIWAIGLRNPFTFGFQPGTTRMFINDVGAGTFEEVNDGIAGSNYGWPDEEGPGPNPNYRDPLLWYGHGFGSTSTGCAIVGAAFYNPPILQFPASYVGKYFFGDLCNDWIRVMDTTNNTSTVFASAISGALVDIHIGPDGALYYLVQSGQVRRVQATPSQAMNISTRAQIGTGPNVLIGGFIVTGTGDKRVMIRGIGPSSGVAGALIDPFLELRGPPPSNTLLMSNDDWQDSQAAEITSTGLAPGNAKESAIVTILQPGNYTAIVSGVGGTSGIGLAEVYDLDPAATSQLGNISGRAFVQTGPAVAIGGFIIGGNNIGASRVVLRAIGPSSGVAGALADPTLELRDANAVLLASNDDWQDDPTQAAQITATGLAPGNAAESAIYTGLAPGNYTAIMRGAGGTTGIGLVEVYKLP